MTASKDTKHQTCFYCDRTFVTSRSAVGDHFPIPRRHGGTETVPCCQTCHSLKDRISIGSWNLEMINKVAADFPKMSCETRLFLAKCMLVLQDSQPDA